VFRKYDANSKGETIPMNNASTTARRLGLSLVCIGMMLLALIVTPISARAQLIFTISPDTKSGAPGGSVTFFGTLSNTGAAELFLNGDNFSLSGASLSLDDSPFLTNFPLSLQGGESASGDLFTVAIGPNTPAGIYPGSFTILGGPRDTDFNGLATRNFTLAVPEPGIGAWLLCGGLALGFFGLRGYLAPGQSSRLHE
jgi:hypothetical protein